MSYPAKVTTTLVVELGELAIEWWAPSDESDGSPVAIRDTDREQTVTYTDLDGISEFRDQLARFIEHHRAITGTRSGLPTPRVEDAG